MAFTKEELTAIAQLIAHAPIKGVDAPAVAHLLAKIQAAVEAPEKEAE